MSGGKLFNSFEDSEFETEETSGNAVDAVVNSFSEEEVDEELAEAEKRLSKAAYYKQIVRNGVMEDDGSGEATEINLEAKQWARQQMAKLLNLPGALTVVPSKAESQFSDKEVFALKKVAERVLLSQGERPVDPVVNKIKPPEAPIVKKAKAPTQTPVKKVVPTKAEPIKPEAKPETPKKDKPPKLKKGADYNKIPLDTVFEENGKLFKMREHPTEVDPETKAPRRIKMQVTGQVRDPKSAPPPTKEEVETMSQIRAQETLNALPKNNQLVQLANAMTQGR